MSRRPESEPALDNKFREMFRGVDEFLCIPLAASDEVMGEIIVDNAITRKPVTPADVRLAGLCGLLAGNYMMTDRLYRRLLDAQREAAVGEVAHVSSATSCAIRSRPWEGSPNNCSGPRSPRRTRDEIWSLSGTRSAGSNS